MNSMNLMYEPLSEEFLRHFAFNVLNCQKISNIEILHSEMQKTPILGSVRIKDYPIDQRSLLPFMYLYNRPELKKEGRKEHKYYRLYVLSLETPSLLLHFSKLEETPLFMAPTHEYSVEQYERPWNFFLFYETTEMKEELSCSGTVVPGGGFTSFFVMKKNQIAPIEN